MQGKPKRNHPGVPMMDADDVIEVMAFLWCFALAYLAVHP